MDGLGCTWRFEDLVDCDAKVLVDATRCLPPLRIIPLIRRWKHLEEHFSAPALSSQDSSPRRLLGLQTLLCDALVGGVGSWVLLVGCICVEVKHARNVGPVVFDLSRHVWCQGACDLDKRHYHRAVGCINECESR